MSFKVITGVLWALVAVMGGLALWVWQKPAPSINDWGADLKTAAESEREAAGKTVPDFSLPTLEPFRGEWGTTLDYQDFAGKTPMLINFWASWCVPCREEAALLEAGWKTYGERVQFLGINYRDQEADALDFIEEFGHNFPSGADPRGEAALDFGLFGVPTTYFVDRDGTIRTVKVGEISADELESNLERLLSADAQ